MLIKTLKANWQIDYNDIIYTPPKIDISKLSEEERADLIIDKLKRPFSNCLMNQYRR